jgi:chitinase
MVFTVTLSNPYDIPVTVDFATADLTPEDESWYGPAATAGIDYTATFGTVTFTENQTTQTIKVPIIGDRLPEYSELFFVNFTNPSVPLSGYSQAIGTILNDEPYASVASASVIEGNTGSKMLDFTVTLSAAYDAPLTVAFATADGSATVASGDYQATSGSVTFAVNQTTQIIHVPINGDRLAEGDEFFYVNLGGGYYATGYGTIVDDEPRISINGASVAEGDSGTKLLTFTVSLSAAYDQTVTVRYSTKDGSATAGTDYVATSGTLTFLSGQTSKTFTVAIKGDRNKESDEYFYVLLSNASNNALLAATDGLGTILNDDGVKGGGKGRNSLTTSTLDALIVSTPKKSRR